MTGMLSRNVSSRDGTESQSETGVRVQKTVESSAKAQATDLLLVVIRCATDGNQVD